VPLQGHTGQEDARGKTKLTQEVYESGGKEPSAVFLESSSPSGNSAPHVRNFLTLCLSGNEKIARKLIPQIAGLGFYPTGEKQDDRIPGVWRFYFSIRAEDVKVFQK
jgi:hypothetical protein